MDEDGRWTFHEPSSSMTDETSKPIVIISVTGVYAGSVKVQIFEVIALP